MKLFTNAKRTLSLVLAVAMALTMMSVMSVSAEDTTTETETETVSVYDRFTWSPLRGVTATAGETTTETTTDAAVPLADAEALKATVYSIEEVENEDGTVTGYKVTTTNSYVANDDGTTATVTTTVKKAPTVIDNPAVENGKYFKFGIYSDRDGDAGARGYYYATDLNPWVIYADGNYGNGFGVPGSGNLTLNNQHTLKLASNVTNVSKSFYLTMSQTAAMQDTVIFRVQQFNEMALTFVAPEDGVYSASGIISKVRTDGVAEAEGVVNFYVAKIDENGVEHTLSEKANVPAHSAGTADIPDVKVALKAGEQLVLRTDNNLNYVGKVFVENYLVTKWDYTEAEDKSTVTVNYGYQNHAFMNVYGEDYAIGDSNFKTLWNVKAARFDPTTDDLVATIDFNKMQTDGAGKNRLYVADGTFRTEGLSDTNCSSAVTYRADGSIMADVDYRYLTETVTDAESGEKSSVNNYYKYGLQFTYTVPEDGTVVLTGGRNNNTSAILIERVGIKKAGSDQVTYGVYYATGGGSKYQGTRGIWNYCYYDSSHYYRTHNIGALEAGDQIVYEISLDRKTAGTWERVYLDTLNVALTTENSVADVNGDFKGDASDVVYLRKYLLRKFDASDATAFDLTGDEKADLRDLVKIKKIVAGVE